MSFYGTYSGSLGGGGGGGAAITSINTDTTPGQFLTVGAAGTDFAIANPGAGSHVFNLPVASATNTGKLSNTDWSTFNSKQAALTIGNLTDAGTDGITIGNGVGAVIGSGTTISQHVADATHNGYLLNTDWVAFNAKQGAGNYITALTGDVTASGPGSATATLATVATAGTTGSSTAIPVVTINAKGLTTGITTAAVIAPAGTLTGNTLASNVLTSSLTTVGTIGTGAWQGTAVGAAYGGTGGSSASSTGIAHVSSGTWSYSAIVNADVSSSAAIVVSKLAGIPYTAYTHSNTGATLAEGFYLWTLTNSSNDTATMPAASSNSGRIIRVKLAATTASFNTLTVSSAGSDTFTLADGTTGATSLVFYTGGEEYELLSDGTSVWQVINHYSNTFQKSYSAFTNATGFGTIASQSNYWWRTGNRLFVRGYVKIGTPTAAAGPIALPSGLVLDTSTEASGSQLQNLGIAWYQTTSGTAQNNIAFPGAMAIMNDGTDTANLYLSAKTASNEFQKTAASTIFNANDSFSFEFNVPIVGWKA